MADNNQIQYILDDIRSITENIVIKFSSQAAYYETADTKREGDKFVAAKKELDIFTSHKTYYRDELIAAGILDNELIMIYEEDKYQIPLSKRDAVLAQKRKSIIAEFVEENNYYRDLIGLPPMEETEVDYLYLTPEQMEYYGIDEYRPIHEYPLEILIKLERDVIPGLIARYPEKTYLQHMGSKAVDLVRARESKNFEIIFSDIDLDNVFLRSFFETYAMCREYFMSVIYNNSFSKRYYLYDNFMGLNIMVMCIQRMIVNTIKLSIDRDFYDLNSIKKLFECYGVPFFEDLPLDYQRIIVKNLNVLIRTKSTDKVLYDLSNILMYERINIYKYFLVKERIMEEDGSPRIVKKTIVNQVGELEEVYDYEKMYNVYFQSTDIMEPNIKMAIENASTKYSYLEVTEEDMLWWDDANLKTELYERDFNYIETKYLGVNMMYNLTDLIYDTVYFLNLIEDHKETNTEEMNRLLYSDSMKTGTDYLYVDLSRLSPVPTSIFDAMVILCALVSKKNGMKGNIIHSTPTQILHVKGFNFEANFDLIRQKIKEYPRIFKNQDILKYIDLLDVKKVEDINTIYTNFRNFSEFCSEMIATTENIQEYKAYKELFRVISIREETGKAFTLPDGRIANTFMEYLKYKLPNIASMIENLHKDKMGVYIEHVIGKLNELVPDIEYLSAINGTNNNIVTALVSLINFFKSYTTDLRNLNVIYIMSSKYDNMIRLVDDPRIFSKMRYDQKPLKYHDIITGTHITFPREDRLDVIDNMDISGRIVPKDYVINYDKLKLENNLSYRDRIINKYNDMITDYAVGYYIEDKPDIKDTIKVIKDPDPKNLFDKSKWFFDNMLDENNVTNIEFAGRELLNYYGYEYYYVETDMLKLSGEGKLILTISYNDTTMDQIDVCKAKFSTRGKTVTGMSLASSTGACSYDVEKILIAGYGNYITPPTPIFDVDEWSTSLGIDKTNVPDRKIGGEPL